MRCKNCGTENEEGRYICSNCGSPLYDEDEAVPGGAEEGIESRAPQDAGDLPADSAEDGAGYHDDKNTKVSVGIIVILAVIIVALIAGIVFAVSGGRSRNDEESISVSGEVSTAESSSGTMQSSTASPSTTFASTASPSTTATTRQTTTTTTTAVTYTVSVDIDGNGKVSGDGAYTSGSKATLTATASKGYEFAGWYDSSNSLVASGTTYTITVTSDRSLTARFTAVTTTTTTTTAPAATDNADE